MLEELDNNVEMATEVLREECGKEEFRVEPSVSVKQYLPELDQNRILKKAVASMYKKIMVKERELEQERVKSEQIKKENEALKMQNKLLMNQELVSSSYDYNHDVYWYNFRKYYYPSIVDSK